MHTQFQSSAVAPNISSQSSSTFNANFLNGFGGQTPVANTNNRVPMSQVNIAQKKATALGNNLLSFNDSNKNAMMSPTSWTNNNKNESSDKTVALSAQEINDFLS